MPLARGNRLGPYEIVARIGEGGMGEVWKANDSRLGREVAIKTSRAAFNERFEREARAVAALNHPNICTLYDVGPDYLVMEFIDGQPLHGPMPLEQALRVAVDIAGALDAAHRKGIIHRDLKPANILMSKGAVKLLDFGLAKMAQSKAARAEETVTQAISREGSIVGTLQYMAPEQLQGHEADARSDIFSFGCVLYELLGGQRAFHGKDSASVIASILKDEPPPIPTGAVLPKSLDRVVRKCLAKDPDRRWQTAADLRDELQWIAAGGATDVTPTAPHAKRWRNIVPWLVAGMCAVLAVAAYFAAHRTPAQANNRVVRFPLILPEDALPYFDISPDGAKVLFYRRQAGKLATWLYSLESGQISALTGAGDSRRFTWMPDSRGLLFQTGKLVQKIDLTGGPPTTLAETAGFLSDWAPGGILNSNPPSNPGLSFIPLNGEPKVLTQVRPPESFHSGQTLPDNKHFLVLAMQNGYGATDVRLGYYDGGSLKTVMKSDNFPYYVEPGYLLYLRGETLVAQAFDASRGTLTGTPQMLAQKIGRSPSNLYVGSFAASQNGVLIYQHGSRYKETTLTWFDRGGHALGNIGDAADYSNPALSPDGKRLAVGIRDPLTDMRDIWIYDLDRGGKTRLTFGEGDTFNPVWSPDGTRIVYSSQRKVNRDLYIRNVSGAGEEKELLISNVSKAAESWSSDGRYLSFNYQAPGNSDLYLMPMDTPGKPPIPFRATRFGEQSSQFSPDARLIAYRTNESGKLDVYVQTLAENGGRWQISTAGGDDPAWRADGKELYYVSTDDVLMAVDIERSGDSIRAGAPKKLFPVTRILGRRNRYVVSRDGQRFMVVAAEPEKKPEPPVVVLNWPALLKKN